MTSEESRYAIDQMLFLAEGTMISQKDASLRKRDHLHGLMQCLKRVVDVHRRLVPAKLPPDSRTLRSLTALSDSIIERHSDLIHKCGEDSSSLLAFLDLPSYANEPCFVRLRQAIERAVASHNTAPGSVAAAASGLSDVDGRRPAGRGRTWPGRVVPPAMPVARVDVVYGAVGDLDDTYDDYSAFYPGGGGVRASGVVVKVSSGCVHVSSKGEKYLVINDRGVRLMPAGSTTLSDFHEEDFVRFDMVMQPTPRATQAGCVGEGHNVSRME